MNTDLRFSFFTRIPEGCSGSMTTWSTFASDLGWVPGYIPAAISVTKGREMILCCRTMHDPRFVEYRGVDNHRMIHVFKIFND